jgi:hypothetical protein
MKDDYARRPVAVYWRTTPTRSGPDLYVTEAQAEELRARGEARAFGRRGKTLRMIAADAAVKPELAHAAVRDDSCRMGPEIIQANAEGSPRAAALTDGWATNHAAFGPCRRFVRETSPVVESGSAKIAQEIRDGVGDQPGADVPSPVAYPHAEDDDRAENDATAAACPPQGLDGRAAEGGGATIAAPARAADGGNGSGTHPTTAGPLLPSGSSGHAESRRGDTIEARIVELATIGLDNDKIAFILRIREWELRTRYATELRRGRGIHCETVHRVAFEAMQAGKVAPLHWFWERLNFLMNPVDNNPPGCA